MSILDRALDRAASLQVGARFALDIPKLLPFARQSPALVMHRWAEQSPQTLALAYEDRRYTWSALAQHANRYAAWATSRGIGPGDVVALMMDNRPEYVFVAMGLNSIGAIAALINTNLTGAALAHALRASKARTVLVGSEHLPETEAALAGAEDLADMAVFVQYEDPREGKGDTRRINEAIAAASTRTPTNHSPKNSETFCYIYTSGTTGLPKAAVIRNHRMIAANVVFGRLMHRSEPGDVIYVPLPLYHSSAMFLGWGAALATGAAVALRKRFSASKFWDDVHKFRATSFIYIGELCRYLLNTPEHDLERAHNLRVAVGNGLRPDIWEQFQARFNVPVVREFYGSTEGNAPTLNLEGRPGMIGRLSRGQVIVKCDLATGELIRNSAGFCEEVRPGEVGLMLGRINALMSFQGYVDEKATQKKILENVFKPGDKYFNTGDLIQLHEDRWLSFADRIGDTFRWKGENVSTNEVAEILNGAGGILESNVYGVQVPHTDGRAGMAALTVGDDFDLGAFASYVCENLATYQRPLFVRVLDSSDMRITGTFKHQKVDYRKEGFDPSAIKDALYMLRDGAYVPIDADLYAQVESGEVAPG